MKKFGLSCPLLLLSRTALHAQDDKQAIFDEMQAQQTPMVKPN